MTVKELCELDGRIIALQIEIRNPSRLQKIIEIGHTIYPPRYDKYENEEDDITYYHSSSPIPTPRIIIRRKIQHWFTPEINQKTGMTRGRFTGVDLKQIPEEIKSLTITQMIPTTGTFFGLPVEGSEIGFHGYILWCTPNGFEALEKIQAKKEEADNVSIDELLNDWEGRMKAK